MVGGEVNLSQEQAPSCEIRRGAAPVRRRRGWPGRSRGRVRSVQGRGPPPVNAPRFRRAVGSTFTLVLRTYCCVHSKNSERLAGYIDALG